MLTLSVTNQDSTSPEYGTSTTLDLPDKSLVSYQYSLESDDLSAFTSAYTTSINLPPTHKNLIALNQPQIHGTGGVFTYVLSDDSQEIDHGQFVISSVTDTINVNLFSTVATLNTVFSSITSFVDSNSKIRRADGVQVAAGAVYDCLDYHTWQYLTQANYTSGYAPLWSSQGGITSSQGLFGVGVANIGIPTEHNFDSQSFTYYTKYETSWKDRHTMSVTAILGGSNIGTKIPILSAPTMGSNIVDIDSFDIASNNYYQYRWYQMRTLIPLSAIFNSLVYYGKGVSDNPYVAISSSVKKLLDNYWYIGPRISDVLSSDEATTFTLSDVFAKLGTPWTLVKKLMKKFNIRIAYDASAAVPYSMVFTDEYYIDGEKNIASYLDYNRYELKPYSYQTKTLAFEDEPVGSAWQDTYKNITGKDYSRGTITTSYPVTSEKSWFSDKLKYAITPGQYVYYRYYYVKDTGLWKDKNTPVGSTTKSYLFHMHDMIEAFGEDGSEIDIFGSVVCNAQKSLAGYITCDSGTIDTDTGEEIILNGYHQVMLRDFVVTDGSGSSYGVPDVVHLPVITTVVNGVDHTLYGDPLYVPTGTNIRGTIINSMFSDVIDSASASLCEVNVLLDKFRADNSLDISKVVRSIYWFDSSYWCIYKIQSYVAGSGDPCKVTFLRINDLSNYRYAHTYQVTYSGVNGSVSCVDSEGHSVPSGTYVDWNTQLTFSFTPSSGCQFDHWSTGSTNSTMTYNVTENVNVVGTALHYYTITASVDPNTPYGTVSPLTQTVKEGSSALITATPNSNYIVSSWLVDGTATDPLVSQISLINVTSDHTVVCRFAEATSICSIRPVTVQGTYVGADIKVYDADNGTIYAADAAVAQAFTCPLYANVFIEVTPTTDYTYVAWYNDSTRTIPSTDITLFNPPLVFKTTISDLNYNRYVLMNRTGTTYHSITTTANPSEGYHWSAHATLILDGDEVQLTYNSSASYTFGSIEVYNSLNQWVTLTNNYTDPDGTVFTRSSNHVNVTNVKGDHTVRINSTYVPPSTYKCTVNCSVPNAIVTYRINSGSNQTISSFPYEITGLHEDNSVYLTYSHSPYSDFSSWTGYQPSGNTTVSFAMPAYDVSMTANASTYTVTLADSPSGSVSEFSIEGTYVSKTATSVTAYAGSVVSLSYTPADGYSADGWTDISGSSPSRSYTVTSDTTLTARCQSGARPKVTVSLPSALYQAGASLSYAINGGSVEDFGQGGILPVDSGDRVDLYITHNDGNGNSYVTTEQFTWGSEGSAGSSHIFKTNITSDWTIGVCSANQYTIDASVDGSTQHGTASVTYTNGGQVISSTDLVYAGAYVTVHVVLDSDWFLDRWSSDNSPEPNHSIRKSATAEHWLAILCQKIYISRPIASPESGVSSFSVVLNGSTPITSFPYEVTAGNSVVITANLNINYDVTGWSYTGGSGVVSNNVLTISSISENVDATINLQQFAYVTAVMADGVPGSITNVEYSTDSGSTWTSLPSWSVGSEGHVPVDSQIRITSSSTWTNNPYCETDDASSEVATGNPATFTQLLYNSGAIEFTFYWSQSTVYKTINVTGEEGAIASGVTFTYQVSGESELPLPSGGVSLAVGTNVTLRYYHETSTAGTYYDDAYQWKSGSSVIASNVNYFTISSVTTDLNLTVSSKQFTVSFSEYPTLSGAVNFRVNSSSQNVTSYTAFAGTSYSVLAISGNMAFSSWRDGASNPRSEVVPDNNTTTLEALYEQGYSVGPIEDSLYQGQAIFENLTLTITQPGGSPEEYEPSASHPNIRVGSTVEVSYTLDNHYTANNWSIGQTTYPASTTTFIVTGQMSPMTLNVTEWLHVYGSYIPEGGGSLASFSYSTDSGQSWTYVGIPSPYTAVAVPNNSLVKFDCSSSSGYIFREWQLDGTTLAGSGYVQNYTWNSMSVPSSSLNPMITAVFSGGSTWDGLEFSPVGDSSTIYLEYYQDTEGTVPIPDCEYSTDGTTWTAMPKYQAGTPAGTPLTFTSAIYVRGLNAGGWYQGSSNSYGNRFIISGNTYASGNIMSLIGQTSTAITTIPNTRCFCRMFSGCTALASMPTLNATNVTQFCYYRMFQNCTGLTSTSSLPAINPQSASNSCSYMFYGCSNLTEINAGQMLHTASTVTATNYWVQGVAASGTFYAKTGSVWPTASAHAIPSGWTRQDV